MEADPAVAGAENATLSITAESESSSEGITQLEVVSPEGYDATGTELESGPAGWTLSVTDRGFLVTGDSRHTRRSFK